MKILSWNCCLPPWALTRGRRLPKIVLTALDSEPDIICLQEVFFKSDAQKIVELLSSHGFVDSYHFKDLLTVSKFPLLDKKGQQYRSQGGLFSLAVLDAAYGKGFQIVKFMDGDTLTFLANTHLLSAWAVATPGLQHIREQQAHEVCQSMTQLPEGEKIILGDFNFQPKTLPYQEFTKMNFKDDTNDQKTTTRRTIDYVMLNNNPLRKAEIASFNTALSDHAALVAVI